MKHTSDLPSQQPLISVQDVKVVREGIDLFENLDFNWSKGEHWAVVGSSNALNSQFLQVMMGRIPINQGHIYAHFAEDYLKQHARDGRFHSYRDLIAYVSPQHHFKSRNNTQDFYYQQRFNSSDADEAVPVQEYLESIRSATQEGHWTVKRVLETFHLQTLADKSLIKLSNGESRRLMLAAALVRNPSVLLLDNPLVGLDTETRQQFDRLLAEVAETGIYIMMATNVHEIPDVVNRVAVLHAGKLQDRSDRRLFSAQNYAFLQETSIDIHLDNELFDAFQSDDNIQTFQHIVLMSGVTVKYGAKTILDNISWEVNPGDRWALRGHNGAGKSTLLSLINGDNPQAYSNDIWLFDRKRGTGESIWQIKKHIGFVSPELHQFFPKTQSCLQVVLSGLFDTSGLFRQVTEHQRQLALKWMKAFNIDALAGKRLAQLPLNLQRLCLLARALIKSPALLILDEPCQGLDHLQRDFFKVMVSKICRSGNTTLIYVSHYLEDIPEIVDQTITLEDGKRI